MNDALLALGASTARPCLLLGAMSNAPLEPVGPIRGLAAPVVNYANNLTHPSAKAPFNGGAARQERLFGPSAAALAQRLGKARHGVPSGGARMPLHGAHACP